MNEKMILFHGARIPPRIPRHEDFNLVLESDLPRIQNWTDVTLNFYQLQ